MGKAFYLLVTGMFLVIHTLNAQDVINTDRPDQSDGTHNLRKGQLQIETGLQYSKLDEFTRGFDNQTLIRYGINKEFEIRLLNQYSVVRDSGSISGIQPLTVSFKNQLWKQHGILPKVTLVSYFQLPVTISKDFRGDHFGYSFVLAGRNELSSKMKLYTNIGIKQDQQSTDISYPTAVELNYGATDKLSAFIEYFGSYATHVNATNGMDVGCVYAIKNNFAIDIAVGSSTFKLATNRFISFGLSARFPK
ncbi:MAG: transporter [Ferruginibacter sp.]